MASLTLGSFRCGATGSWRKWEEEQWWTEDQKQGRALAAYQWRYCWLSLWTPLMSLLFLFFLICLLLIMEPNPTKLKNRLKLVPHLEHPKKKKKKKKKVKGLCSDPLASRTTLGESTMKGSSSKTHLTDTASKKTPWISCCNPLFYFLNLFLYLECGWFFLLWIFNTCFLSNFGRIESCIIEGRGHELLIYYCHLFVLGIEYQYFGFEFNIHLEFIYKKNKKI